MSLLDKAEEELFLLSYELLISQSDTKIYKALLCVAKYNTSTTNMFSCISAMHRHLLIQTYII